MTATILASGGVIANDVDFELEEIIVTAEKREQSLQDIPFTVNAYTTADIESARITEVDDIALLTPGLEFGAGIGRQVGFYSIRGINSGTLGSSGVVTYIDGFTLGNNFTVPNVRLFELERIEVLKGPQATLYGRNALGGVISYITQKPSNEFSAKLAASYGNYDAIDVSGVVSGPIIEDVLAVQFGVAYRERDGFFDNPLTADDNFNDEGDRDYRFALHYTPNDELTANLTINHNETRDDAGASGYIPLDYDLLSPTDLRDGLIDLAAYEDELFYNNPGFFDRDITTAVLNIAYDFEHFTLTSVTGYGKIDIDTQIDVDRGLDRSPVFAAFFGLPSIFVDESEERDVFSQELRLSSNTPSPLQWLIGAYAFYEEFDRVATTNGALTTDATTNEIDNLALFANVSYDFTDKLTVGLGLRYDATDTDNDDNLANLERSSDEDETLPKVFLTYAPHSDLTVFASAAKGFKAGGFNPLGLGANTYDAESIWHYELGVKGKLADSRVRYGISYFHIDWDDQQLTQFDGITTFFNNAGESTIDGIEAEIVALLAPGLELSGAIAWTDAEFDEFTLGPADGLLFFGIGADLSGNDIPYTPELSFSGSVQYSTAINDAWETRLRFDASYTDERNFHFTGLLPQDDFWLANLYVGVASEQFEIGLFGDNIFDEEFHTLGDLVPILGPVMGSGDPRTYGLKLVARF